VVYEAILAEGEEELRRPTSALAFSGLAAGLSMGFRFLTQGFLEAGPPAAQWRGVVAKLGYSVGFVIVILGRQQLFTENTLTPIIPLLKRKQTRTLLDALRLWTTVFLTNWVGTMAVAWALAQPGIIGPEARPIFAAIGQHSIAHSFGEQLLKAVFAGWLIALLGCCRLPKPADSPSSC